MNNSKTCLKIGLTSACFLAATAITSDGSGFDVPDQDAFAVGRGLANTATADDPSAIFFNPAGLTQLTGNNFRVGLYGIDLDAKYTPPGGGNTFHNQMPWGALPQLFYAYRNPDSKFSFGVGIYAPAGLSIKWQDTTGFRTLGTLGTVQEIAFNPVVAYKLLPSLSVGAGLSANYGSVDLRQGILWPNSGRDQFQFQGDGWGMAGNLGLRWQPIEKLAFGASLHTGVKMNIKGTTTAYNSVATPLPPPLNNYPTFNVTQGAKTDLQFPLNVTAGVSYRPTKHWNIEFDAEYIDWSSIGTLNIQQDSAVPPLFPQDIPLVLQWDSSWYYLLGATRYFDNGWHVSAGYIFNQNSVPSSHYTTVVADEDRHFFSVGIGRKGVKWDFDIAYQFGWGPDRTITGSAPSATGQRADGTYGFISNAIALSVGLHF